MVRIDFSRLDPSAVRWLGWMAGAALVGGFLLFLPRILARVGGLG